MPSFKDFFQDVIKSSGLDEEDYKDFINDLPEKDIPDEVHEKFHNTFLTLDAARNNPDVARHFEKKYLASTDNALLSELKGIVPEDSLEEFNKEKNSVQKARKAIKIARDYYNGLIEEEKSKKKPTNAEEVKELQDRINKLQEDKANSLQAITDEYEGKIKQLETNFENERYNSTVNDQIGEYQFAENDVLKKDDYKTLIKTKLNDMPYTFRKSEDGKYLAYKKDNPDEQVFVNNKPVTLGGAIEQVATPFVKKSDPDKGERKTVTTTTKNGSDRYTFGSHAKKPA